MPPMLDHLATLRAVVRGQGYVRLGHLARLGVSHCWADFWSEYLTKVGPGVYFPATVEPDRLVALVAKYPGLVVGLGTALWLHGAIAQRPRVDWLVQGLNARTPTWEPRPLKTKPKKRSASSFVWLAPDEPLPSVGDWTRVVLWGPEGRLVVPTRDGKTAWEPWSPPAQKTWDSGPPSARPRIRYVRTTWALEGITELVRQGVTLRVQEPARAAVDCVRFRSRLGRRRVAALLREALSSGLVTPDAMRAVAAATRLRGPVNAALAALSGEGGPMLRDAPSTTDAAQSPNRDDPAANGDVQP